MAIETDEQSGVEQKKKDKRRPNRKRMASTGIRTTTTRKRKFTVQTFFYNIIRHAPRGRYFLFMRTPTFLLSDDTRTVAAARDDKTVVKMTSFQRTHE